MSGWEKVAAATVLALIGLLGLNLAIWRRVRDATAASRRSADQIEDDSLERDEIMLTHIQS